MDIAQRGRITSLGGRRLTRILQVCALLSALSCGRSDLDSTSADASSGVGSTSSGACNQSYPGRLDPHQTQFDVVFRNRCNQTIWPALGRVDGLDQSVADPTLWAPVAAGADRQVTIHEIVDVGIALWGRTGCSFDSQGNGSCQTGDCGALSCSTQVNQLPSDATIYDFESGYRRGYNIPISVDGACCGNRQCVADLAQCPAEQRIEGPLGVVACKDVCPYAVVGCCHPYSNGCYAGGEVVVTFCPAS